MAQWRPRGSKRPEPKKWRKWRRGGDLKGFFSNYQVRADPSAASQVGLRAAPRQQRACLKLHNCGFGVSGACRQDPDDLLAVLDPISCLSGRVVLGLLLRAVALQAGLLEEGLVLVERTVSHAHVLRASSIPHPKLHREADDEEACWSERKPDPEQDLLDVFDLEVAQRPPVDDDV